MQAGVRGAVPQRQRLGQPRLGQPRLGQPRLAGCGDQVFEATCVDGVVGQHEGVAGGPRHEHRRGVPRPAIRLQGPAQLGDVHLQRGQHLWRRVVAPQLIDEAFGAHGAAAGGDEHTQQGPRLSAAQRHGVAVAHHLEVAEHGHPDAGLHAGTQTGLHAGMVMTLPLQAGCSRTTRWPGHRGRHSIGPVHRRTP